MAGDSRPDATGHGAAGTAPDDPTDLEGRSWKKILKRTVKGAGEDGITDWAAALTYYAVLSLFPGMLVLVALLGVFGQHPQTTDAVLEIVGDIGPDDAADTFAAPIEQVTASGAGAGALLGVGLIGALWAASGYVGAFARAANGIYGVEEGRGFLKMRPQQVGITILMLGLLTLVLIGFVVSGPVAETLGDRIGLGDAAVTVWDIAKWPVMVLLVAGMIAVLYNWAPNVRQPRFRWLTPGSLFAVVLWIVASVAFAFYVANFGSYNATYGSLAGVIIFLLWLWISQIAVLMGLELNVEMERQRELESGVVGAEEGIQRPFKEEP